MGAMNVLLRRSRASLASALALCAVLAAGCDNDKKVESTDASDAGVLDAGRKPILDKNLQEAMAAASSAQAPASSAGAADGPPQSGVFTPEAAEAAAKSGAPAKLELLGEGSDPKVALTFAPSGEQKAHVVVGLRFGQSMLPNVDFGLSFKVEKGKEEGSGYDVLAKVASAGPAKDQPGQLPKETTAVLGKLKGSEIKLHISPRGAITEQSSTLAKGVEPGIDVTFTELNDALSAMIVPLPDKPVGVGGYWMVTDRSSAFGIDLIRYRVFRVQEISEGKARLGVEIRQYAAKPEAETPAGKLKLDRFESQGKGEVGWSSSLIVAPESAFKTRLMAIELSGAAPGQVKGLQAEVVAETLAPEAKK